MSASFIARTEFGLIGCLSRRRVGATETAESEKEDGSRVLRFDQQFLKL